MLTHKCRLEDIIARGSVWECLSLQEFSIFGKSRCTFCSILCLRDLWFVWLISECFRLGTNHFLIYSNIISLLMVAIMKATIKVHPLQKYKSNSIFVIIKRFLYLHKLTLWFWFYKYFFYCNWINISILFNLSICFIFLTFNILF